MAIYLFLLGVLPFVNVCRFSPVPTFWTEWCVVCLALILSIHRTWQTRGRTAALRPTSVTIGLAGLSTLLLIQFQQGMVASRINALVAAALLLLCLVFYGALRESITEETREPYLKAWSYGVLVALFCQVIATALLWSGKDWTPFHFFPTEVPTRMFGTFGQPNQFGVFLVLSLATLLFLVRARIIPQPLFLVMWVTASVLVAASGSRAALLCWIVLVGLHLVQLLRRADSVSLPFMTQGWRLVFLHMLFAGIQVAWSMWGSGWQTIKVENHLYDTATIDVRYEQYRDVFALMKQEPILGYGFEKFAQARFYELTAPLQEPNAIHTHNIFTNTYIDFGLPGFVLLMLVVSFVMFLGVRGLKSSQSDLEASVLVCSWVAGLLVYACLEHPFNYAHFLILFIALLAFLPAAKVYVGEHVSRILNMGRLFVLVVAMGGAVFIAVDYRRIQEMVFSVEAQVQTFGLVKKFPPLLYLLDLQQKTIFVDYVDLYLLQSMGPGGKLAKQKIEMAQRLFERSPKGDTLALYVSHLAAGESAQQQHALALMCLMGQRNRVHFDWAMEDLRARAKFEASTQAFLDTYQDPLHRSCR